VDLANQVDESSYSVSVQDESNHSKIRKKLRRIFWTVIAAMKWKIVSD